MSLHKLTAGDGYTYLTRQVAAHDATNRGFDNLGDYYSEKGETPGVWLGRGLAAVPEFPVGKNVTEAQMLALFGQGRHPNAVAIERAAATAGRHPWHVDQASMLGRPYRVFEQTRMFHRRSAGAFRDYNTTRGLPGDTSVPAEERARIRTVLARAMFVEEFGRDPVDARELSGHLARISRQATTAVAGYDLTFSPVKSVSTLWAVAPREIAKQIERAHLDSVNDVLAWLEDTVAYTRTGPGAVAQVEVQGLIAAAFTHRDSRAGDPDLHTHVAISNKVQTLDGRWLALDGRPVHKNVVAASERYNTRLEALLISRLGVAFADRPHADPTRRAVREIVGVDGELPRLWSSRRAAIDVRRAVLSAQFQTDHHRPPTSIEALALAQQANLETRQRKHEPRSFAQQRTAWRAQALEVLGGELPLRRFVRDAMRGGPDYRARANAASRRQPASRVWVEETADTVIASISSSRATWHPHHIRAEAERQARIAGIGLAELDKAVDSVVTEALAATRSIPLSARGELDEPRALLRSDGVSVYTVAGTALFTSPQIVAAEQAIVAMAGRRDGATVAASVVDVAIVESAANGVPLNPGQVQLVRELATSGARVQLALAPAGTGKTTAMRVLSRAWITGVPGCGTVVGLAPSAAAAAVLRDEIGSDGNAAECDTLAKLIWHIGNGGGPAWLTSIGPDTLVVIDEAGMAGTRELATAIEHITDLGGSVRLIGDDQQLAAIGAGGVLRDLAHAHGAVTLSQVMRFTHPTAHPQAGAANHGEGAASLALRAGDPAAIGYYIDHQRLHVGDLSTVAEDAYTAWTADRAAGVDAIMLAPTRDLVAGLNARARTDRLAALQIDQPTGGAGDAAARREVRLIDGSRASVGDTIITRHNERTIAITATDWVKNGDRWTITTVHDTGAMDVRHLRTGRHVTLPADYVSQHVALGYASTVHGAQGITAEVCHTVATGEESRQLIYVAMTRGRHANHVYLTTAGDGDPHTVITRDALLPPTAVDLFTRILARDASPVSATTQARELNEPTRLLATAAHAYHHALGVAAEDHLGPDALTGIDVAAEAAVLGLTRHDAYPTLRAHLALHALEGRAPAEVLRAALTADVSGSNQPGNGQGLSDARDIAAVLDWRLGPASARSTRVGPLPWLPATPVALATDREWGKYLQARADLITELSSTIVNRTRSWTPNSAPAWAAGLIDSTLDGGPDADPDASSNRRGDLVADLALWRAAHDVEDTDRRPTGPPLRVAAQAHAQRALDHRIQRRLGDPRTAIRHWAPLADSIDSRITTDPYWPTLADRLTVAERAGINISALTHAVAAVSPLPDEQPAAALWWRLAARLSPAAMTATDRSVSDTLRPDWAPALRAVLGPIDAGRVLADPAWPALVAAVTLAINPTPTNDPADTAADAATCGSQGGWEPEHILATAYSLLPAMRDGESLRTDQLATALVWHIGMLTDASPLIEDSDIGDSDIDDASFTPSDVSELTPAIPQDLAWLPQADPGIQSGHDHTDPDWLRLLSDPHDDPYDPDPYATDPDDIGLEVARVADGETVGVQRLRNDRVDTREHLAEVLAALAASDHDREVAADAQAARWAGTGASRERLLQLNAAAQTFFASQYETSWAANYVSERLGTDPATAHLTGQDRFSVGYAPAGWTALTTHLRQTGASDAELVAAGLGTYASTGRVIDRFRDRIMFPITTLATDDPNANSAGRVDSEASSVEIHGFIARRNPAKTDEDGSGPKYLNTPETPLFTKGGELFGLADNYAALAAGATPVLVEGPLDAIAVTLAGGGTYVGIAPLGTAFTDTQADKFRPYIGPDRPAIIVAFDADRAGQTAAHRAFWQLAARGGDPAHLQMPDGTDPAALLHTEGATGLRDRLAAAGSLADEVLAAHIAPFTDRLDTIEGRIHALRQAADIVGALPVATWQHRSAHLAAQLGVAPQTAIDEVLAAGEAWTSDPPAHARRHLTERGPTPVKPQEHLDPDPLRRWAPLVDSLRVGLSSDPHWAVLAAHLARAAETGYDVNTRLPLLLALSPLPDGHAGLDLDFRLIADCPECLPPHDPDSATARADQAHAATEARIRMDISNHDAATRSRSVARQSPAPRRTGPSR